MAQSRLVNPGDTLNAADFNALRQDVLAGHGHDGTDGVRVGFRQLSVSGADGSTAPPGGAVSYNQIANHVQGSAGVHGLNAVAHVLGAANSGLLVQIGSFNVPINSSPNNAADGTVTFPIAYTSTPLVFLSWDGYSPNGWGTINVTNRSTTQFSWHASSSNDGGGQHITTGFWLAIGAK